MFKIKSHNRYKSQQELYNSNLGPKTENLNQIFTQINNQKFIQENKNRFLNLKQPNTIQQNYTQKDLHQKANLLKNVRSQRFKSEDIRRSSDNHFQKQLQTIKVFQQQISKINKRIHQESYIRSILTLLVILIKKQFHSIDQKINSKKAQRQNDDQKQNQIIKKYNRKIEKTFNQNNKIIALNKNILQQIKKQRKIRILFQSYFYSLEKEIKYNQNVYYALISQNKENKLFSLMVSSSDIVSNGHFLGLTSQKPQQIQKDLNKNTYMCLPVQSSHSQKQNESLKRKSSKFLGKKGAMKKLAKILSIVQDSKALQSSQLLQYKQEEQIQNSKRHNFSSFKTEKFFNNTFPFNQQQKYSILKKNQKKIYKGRQGKIVSIKMFAQFNSYYEFSFDEVVYELFQLYRCIGMNIFEKSQKIKSIGNEMYDYFSFDQDLLVSNSKSRLEYLKKSVEKMGKFNQTLEKKISSIEQNILQTEEQIQIIEKNIETHKNKKCLEEAQDENQCSEQERKLFIEIANSLGVNQEIFKSQTKVYQIIQKLNFQLKQIKDITTQTLIDESVDTLRQNVNHVQSQMVSFSECKTNGALSSVSNQNQLSNKTLRQMIKAQKNNQTRNQTRYQTARYADKMVKTEGFQRKFHQLILNQDEKQPRNSKINISSRSIYQNGMKSLNNIFGNIKICNNYQRVFEREQFQVEYTKQISKKKRVMFRREAKVYKNSQKNICTEDKIEDPVEEGLN